jgi:hypothetical protein
VSEVALPLQIEVPPSSPRSSRGRSGSGGGSGDSRRGGRPVAVGDIAAQVSLLERAKSAATAARALEGLSALSQQADAEGVESMLRLRAVPRIAEALRKHATASVLQQYGMAALGTMATSAAAREEVR